MPLSTVSLRFVGQIHSPFSGLPAESSAGGSNHDDSTLLFVHDGMSGEWAYVSARIPSEFTRFIDDADPAEVADALEVDGAMVLVVDTDGNGINHYGFAPEESEIKFSAGVEFA